MKPPFAYYGGKTTLAPQIAALLPAHEHYIEPFAGSLAVLLAKKPSREDGAVVNVPLARRMPTDNQIAELARLVHERDRLRAEVGA